MRAKKNPPPKGLMYRPDQAREDDEQRANQARFMAPSRNKACVTADSTSGRGSNVSGGEKPKLPEKTPSLSQMKRFASGRDTLAGFDWTAHQIAPVEFDHSDYYSDEEKVDRFEEEEHEEVIIPFSAPMMVGGGVDLLPRKEINLWKKRTINPPSPLQLRSNMARGN
ncbi:embryo defective family protein [Salix suchowensis]|nr:embryo defective family protein [Salix suchowensis]